MTTSGLVRLILYFVAFGLSSFAGRSQPPNFPAGLAEGPCLQESDCGLFEDQCGVLWAVVKASLPEGALVTEIKGQKIFSWSPLMAPVCDRDSYNPSPLQESKLVCAQKLCRMAAEVGSRKVGQQDKKANDKPNSAPKKSPTNTKK